MKKKNIGVFTIASKNYLAYAKVLFTSLAQIHPEYTLYLCLVDRVDGYFDPSKELYEVVEIEQIGIDNFNDMALRYDIMELNTAVKPFMFNWLFNNTDLDSVIYLDPDICVYNRFEDLQVLLNTGASLVFTPHITRPLEDGKTPNDYHMLQSGVFNLGFLAANRCDETINFMSWWGRRLAAECIADFQANLFVDQKWCDLAPCFLSDFKVLREDGYNVAYWNLAHRSVENTNDVWVVNGKLLVFFHFSGISADERQMVSKHQNRFEWQDIQPLQKLFTQYQDKLQEAGLLESRSWPYTFDYFNNGFKLSKIIRTLYRKTNEVLSVHSEDQRSEYIINLCNQASTDVYQDSHSLISQLMYLVYSSRPDLQQAFMLETSEGRLQYSKWFESAGPREYQLPEILTLQSHIVQPHNQVPQEGRIGSNLLVFKKERISTEQIDWPAAIDHLIDNRFISNLKYMIWLSRKDLQQAFDLQTKDGQQQFLDWCEASILREYGVDIEDKSELARSKIIETRVPRSTIASLVLKGGEILPRFVQQLTKPIWSKVLYKTVESASIDYVSTKNGIPGANLIGYANAELGMGEHVRMSACAFAETNVDFGVVNFNVGVSSRQKAVLSHGVVINENRYNANIFHINADQMLLAFFHLGRAFFKNRYNIGYWAWELSKCPDEWLPVMGFVDEIWAPSRFIQEAFSARTSIPVEYMPLCVSLPPSTGYERRKFHLPDDKYLFLFTFDFLSYMDRKNPFAAIKAFKLAFHDIGQKVGLVIKVMNGDETNPSWQKMLELIDNDPRIFVLNQTMQRDEILSLFEVCDCFVSLHRSEGFGRGPVEAMYYGKPVIVTNYSGNTDFTLPDNSCLVNYKLIPVEPGQYVFDKGQVWADPDIEHAAWHMVKVFTDQAFGNELGMRAKHYVKENFSPDAVGVIYQKRLKALKLV